MAEKKILLVDYDAKSLASLSKLLKSNKFKVVTATDGQAGHDAFLAEKPDLVILEAMLPKIHGFDLTRKITQDDKAHAPVVLITGLYKGPKYRREAIKDLGAAAYFEKPLDPEAFVAAIRRLLHDEDEIDEELPGSDAVIEALSRRDRGRAAARAEAKPTAKGHHP